MDRLKLACSYILVVAMAFAGGYLYVWLTVWILGVLVLCGRAVW